MYLLCVTDGCGPNRGWSTHALSNSSASPLSKSKRKLEGSEWRAAIEVLMMIAENGDYAGAHHARALPGRLTPAFRKKTNAFKLQRFARITS